MTETPPGGEPNQVPQDIADIPPDRGRYMYASGGLFIAGAPWVLAVIFGAHAYRRRGTTSNNVLALVGFAVPALLAVYAIVSSVIYGMGLTD